MLRETGPSFGGTVGAGERGPLKWLLIAALAVYTAVFLFFVYETRVLRPFAD